MVKLFSNEDNELNIDSENFGNFMVESTYM